MDKAIEAMKLAFEALDGLYMPNELERVNKAITAIKEALKEHAMQEVQRLGQEIEQEPVAHCKVRPLRGDESFPKVEIDWVNQPIPGPLFTTPPQRKPLTDEQRKDLMNKAWDKWLGGKDDNHLFAWHFSFEVEAAHGIKE